MALQYRFEKNYIICVLIFDKIRWNKMCATSGDDASKAEKLLPATYHNIVHN